MIINDVTGKTKCDFAGCKNLAEHIIVNQSDDKKRMCFCKECLIAMYECVAKFITPKSIEAPFKKPKKLR